MRLGLAGEPEVRSRESEIDVVQGGRGLEKRGSSAEADPTTQGRESGPGPGRSDGKFSLSKCLVKTALGPVLRATAAAWRTAGTASGSAVGSGQAAEAAGSPTPTRAPHGRTSKNVDGPVAVLVAGYLRWPGSRDEVSPAELGDNQRRYHL